MASVMDMLVRVLGDGGQFRRDMLENQNAVNKMVDKMDGIHDALATIKVDDAESKAKVDQMKEDLQSIRDRTAKVDVNTREGQEEIMRIKTDLANLRDKTVDIKADDADAILAINTVRAELDSLSDKTVNVKANAPDNQNLYQNLNGIGILGSSIMSSIPLITPLLATATAGAMGLASALGAASIGAMGFGAVAIPNIAKITDATSALNKAQDKYNAATNNKQRVAALAEEKKALAGLDDEQKNAVKSLQSFESFWKQFTASFEKPVLGMFTGGLQVLKTILTDLKPTITAATQAFQGLLNDLKQSLGTPPVQQFFSYLASTAGPAITMFGQIAGNVMRGVMSLMVAFGPLGMQMTAGLLRMSQSFASWSANVGKSQGFQQFIAYVRQNGPVLISTIGNIVRAVMNIVIALAPMGAAFLSSLQGITQWLATFTRLHPTIVQVTAAILAAIGIWGLLKGPLALFINFEKAIQIFRELRTAMIGMSVAEKAVAVGMAIMNSMNPIGWILLAIAAIGVLTVAIVTHWNQIKSVTSAVWGSIVGYLGQAWNAIKSTAMSVWNSITAFFRQWGTVLLAVMAPAIGLPLLIAQHWNQIKTFASQIWGAAVSTIRNIWNGFTSWIRGAAMSMANSVVSAFSWLYNHNYYFRDLVNIIRNAWNTIRSVTSSVWNSISSAVSGVWSRIRSVVSAGASAVRSVASAAWNAIRSAASSAWNSISSVISGAWSRVRGTISAGASAIRSVLSGAWNAVRSSASGAWNGIVGTIRGAVGRIRSSLSGIASSAYGWGRNLINMFGDGIKSAIGNVANAAKNAVNSVKKFLGFHSPAEEGPGADADVWAPNLMKMFIGGIQQYTPALQGALNNAIAAPKLSVSSNVAQMITGGNTMQQSGGYSAQGQPSVSYVHQGPLVNIEHVSANNQQDINRLQQAIYDAQASARRAKGVKGI